MSKSGGAGRQGPALNFFMRQFPGVPRGVFKIPRPSALLGGSSVSPIAPSLKRTFRPAVARHAWRSEVPHHSSRRSGPAVVRGGRISDGRPGFRRFTRTSLGPPEPGGHVPLRPQAPLPSHSDDASRERPRRTDGQDIGQGSELSRTIFKNPCRHPGSRKAAIRDLSTLGRIKIPDRAPRVRDDSHYLKVVA